MKLSIVIPAYNEEKRLPPFLESVITYSHGMPGQIHEIIVVDDGSSDATAAIVQARQAQEPILRLIQQPKNMGKGAAIKRGVMEAAGDYIVFIDADGATQIDQLPKMIEALQSADVAVGNRWLQGANVHRSTVFRHISGWLNKTYMSLFGLGSIDTMCGFKGYKAEVARDLFKNLLENRWLFDTEIAYKAVRKDYTIKNFPITWRSIDGSKLDTMTLITSGMAIFPLILKINKQLAK